MTTHEYPVGATPPLGTPKPAVPRPRTYPGAPADDWLRPQPEPQPPTDKDPAPLSEQGSPSGTRPLSETAPLPGTGLPGTGPLSGTSPLPETADGADP
ncbi:segregation/condensation protein A, partial [Streptomyces sp. BF23-18]